MSDSKKTKDQLRSELKTLRARIAQLEDEARRRSQDDRKLQDSSELHRIDELDKELDRVRATLQAAMNQSQAGIAIADENGQVLFINEAGIQIGGKTEADLAASIDEYVENWCLCNLDESPLEKDKVPLARAIMFEETNSLEFLVRNPDRDVVVLANAAPIYNTKGELSGGVVVFLDITDQRKIEQDNISLEKQFRQAQKMESVGRLAGGIAHDFNNLLTTIIGYSEMVESDINQSDPMREDIKEVIRAAESAATLTSQLLSFSRKQIIDPKVIDINQTVERSRKMLARLIGEDIELLFFAGKNLGKVRFDPVQLDQIVVNLAVNARDAMPFGGKLTIETQNASFNEEYVTDNESAIPGEYVMMSVSDNGCGMNETVLGNIFEPFFTTKEKEKGTGLGLSTVYGLVNQHNGFINATSEVGVGTCFKIHLPRVEERIDTITVSNHPANALGKETILLVEDQDAVRALTKRILEKNGYHILAAQDGDNAVDECREYDGDIHLLLTDVIMPRMSGNELYKQIDYMRSGIKVLYMSGYAASAIAHHGVLDEGTAFISKPFKANALLKKVRDVLNE